MKEKFMRFMYGRYGVDSFSRFLVWAALILIVLAKVAESGILSTVSWMAIVYAYYRMFSKNTYKRSMENQKFLAKTAKIRYWFANQKNLFGQRKTHHIYKCPTCRQKIRVPRGKGRIEISCPKCGTKFIKKS